MPSLPAPIDAGTVERVLLHGDLQKLTSSQKIAYYRAVCDSVGLNPLTQPFQYLILNGREILYARREATEQLRQLHSVSITIAARELVDDIYVVTARATLPTGRTDENIGAMPLGTLKGEAKANAMMKAETKAKRRVTLSICGLGMLDETEVASLPPEAVAPGYEHHSSPPLGELAPATDPDLPAGVVRVVRVDSTPTKRHGVTKHTVVLSTGEAPTTINDWLASQAQGFCEQQTPVRAVTEETQWGTNLLKLTPADEGPKLPLEPPVTLEDIPF